MASGKKSRSERSRYWKCCMSAGVVALLGVVVASLGSGKLFGAQKAPFHIEEATISDIQSALLAKRITTVGVVNLRSEEHTSELQSHHDLVCRLLLEKKNKNIKKKKMKNNKNKIH